MTHPEKIVEDKYYSECICGRKSVLRLVYEGKSLKEYVESIEAQLKEALSIILEVSRFTDTTNIEDVFNTIKKSNNFLESQKGKNNETMPM